MLVRINYYDEKRNEIKCLILEVLNDLIEVTVHFEGYFKDKSNDVKDMILKNESFIDKNEKRIEKYILDIISLEQLNRGEIKWLFSMSRIMRELERVGDQLTNIITISDVVDSKVLKPTIQSFLYYEHDMMKWLMEGIQNDNSERLQNVISHDKFVNNLNKKTFQHLVKLVNQDEHINESELKMVIISRFLERIGDHIVNVAKIYIEIIEDNL